MGGGDKAMIPIGGEAILDRVLGPAEAALRENHPECQRRP